MSETSEVNASTKIKNKPYAKEMRKLQGELCKPAIPTPELRERVEISRRLQAEAETLTEPMHQGKCI